MYPKQKLILVCLILLAFSVACSLNSQPANTVDEDTVATMVAQTVAANQSQQTADQPTQSDGSGGGEAEQPAPATDTPVPSETPTNTPEPTATETLTPTPEPTLPMGIDELNLGNPDASYGFNSKGPFYTYSSSDSKVEVKDSTLQFTIFDAISWTIWSFSSLELQDFYFEISVKMPDNCQGKDRGGVIFGTPLGETDKGINYQISCDGHYRLFIYDGANTINLINWTNSDELFSGPGKTNRLGVMHRGQKITLYINGALINQVSDDTYVGKGRIGVNMGVDNHDNVTITFDDAAYWTSLP
jgi:hypothetical protein